jgi:hypothetical protein
MKIRALVSDKQRVTKLFWFFFQAKNNLCTINTNENH